MKTQDLRKILFLDIETVRNHKTWEETPERVKNNWERKASFISPEESPKDSYIDKAGIYAEYGKIVCISVGYFRIENNRINEFRTKSFFGNDEKSILEDFNELLKNKYHKRVVRFCAHNGKEFDYPYICRRMIINNVNLPVSLELSGKKPWEVLHEDTLQLWKFGDYKHYISLEVLATALNIASSKEELSGNLVSETYYQNGDIKKIKEYCEKDIWVLAQIYLKIKQVDFFNDTSLIPVTKT